MLCATSEISRPMILTLFPPIIRTGWVNGFDVSWVTIASLPDGIEML
jgi:hypothetical protein